MPHPRVADLHALLRALTGAGVEFIVVGGAAAVLHGAPVTTQDLDVVHRRTPENVARILSVLQDLDAVVREPGDRRLRPQAVHLQGGGQLNLSTALGPFDPLGKLHDGRGYEELIELSEEVTDGDLELRVIDLPTLIEIKASAGRAKDRLMLPILVALLKERQQGGP